MITLTLFSAVVTV